MATYEYTALAFDQSIVRGTLTALSKRLATKFLKQQTLTIVTLNRVQQPFSLRRWVFRSVGSMDRILFTRSLMTMMRAGMTLTETLESLREQISHPVLRRVIIDIQTRVHQGQSFASCLDRYPGVFPTEFRAMISIGEKSGKLLEVLTYLTEKLESDYRLQRKLRTALTYPTLLVVAMVGVVSIMMLFVIPRVATVYHDANVALPIFTRALVAISTFFVHWFAWIFGIGLALIILLDLAYRRWPAYRRFVHALWLRLPIFGLVMKKTNLTAISRSLSMLLRAGLSIDQSLLLTAKTATNEQYRLALLRAEPFIQRGLNLSDVFKGQPELFLPVFQRMVAAGEQSGSLDGMFQNLARYFDEDLQAWSENISSILEPALIISVGVVVGGIAMAILYPLWNFANIV